MTALLPYMAEAWREVIVSRGAFPIRLSNAEHTMVFRGNAMRLYGLT